MKTPRRSLRHALQFAVGLIAACATCAASWATVGPLEAASSAGAWWTLPIWIALAVALHVGIGGGIKTVLAASRPLAGAEPEVASYERTVYGSVELAMRQVVGLVAVAGLLFWLAARMASPWLGACGGLTLLGALALDLSRWVRVTVSADTLWCQRGLGSKTHHVPIDDIADVAITETRVDGWTLHRGRNHTMCRLNLVLLNKRTVLLPKTDARGNLESVEKVANHIRLRRQLGRAPRPTASTPTPPVAPTLDAPDTVPATRMRFFSTRF